jgi:hypothetical protein
MGVGYNEENDCTSWRHRERGNSVPTTVAGIYKEGRIELLAQPAGIHEGPVLVTLDSVTKVRPQPCLLPYGKYQEGQESIKEDFRTAEWRGELEPGGR